MKKLDLLMDKLEEYLSTVFLSAMSIIIFVQVINRNFFKVPFSWGEELARYSMVWATFIGISAGTKACAHIGVDALVLKLPDNIKNPFLVVSNLFISFIYMALTYLSIVIVMGIKTTNQVSPAMQMPMYVAYLGLVVGMVMSSIRALQSTYQQYKQCVSYSKNKRGGANV